MSRLKTLALAAVLATSALAAHPALGAIVLQDNFDAENGGLSATAYTGFAQFEVIRSAVNLIGPGDPSGLSGAGSFIALDSGDFPGAIVRSTASFSFVAGDVVALRFDGSGNQRRDAGSAGHDIYAGFEFDHALAYSMVDTGGGFPQEGSGGTNFSSGFNAYGAVPWDSPWKSYYVQFVAAEAGTVKVFFGGNPSDGIGPLVDNVSLSIGPPVVGVPEPGTWMLMIVGFGFLGAALRRGKVPKRQAASRLATRRV